MIVKTSKEWVLPPRPKPGRKPVKEAPSTCKSKIKPRKKYQKKVNIPNTDTTTNTSTTTTTTTQLSDLHQDINDISCIMKNIKTIDTENLSLKSTLLSLIHDYKHLKDLVLNPEVITSIPQPLDSNVHKRSYTEVKTNEVLAPSTTPSTSTEFEKFINIDVDADDLHKKSKLTDYFDPVENSDIDIDFDDEYEYNNMLMTSPTLSSELSRTTSPYSDFENNSLMSSLTRTTTVSSIMSFDKPKFTLTTNNKFFELPKYDEEEQDDSDYNFKFDELMNNSKNDQYNMITDFLEEKLITNDIEYYTTALPATTTSDNDLIW
ncbi:hypothetical protein JA1_003967 [Spathaspora sp. JA1]|nr:hypothetical protein JA1_003967 [Spathaspora sp. JA1]